MRLSNPLARCSRILTIALLTGLFPAVPRAADVAEPATSPVSGQRSFASPDEALQALKTAAATKDPAAMSELFGPDYPKLLTGDKAQDAKNAEHFAEIMAQGCEPVAEGDARITFETGTNHWPLPIPLVKADGQWRFDTAAGQEEIINRHVGKDELHAIGVCRAYVTAQRQFALTTAKAGSETKYAQKFMSTTGAKDGLYWPVTENETASPFGPVVAEAQVGNYPGNNQSRPEPFHGYYFKILTRQGPAAPGGKMRYLTRGDLIGGFALVAFPEHWDRSGIMTFIVNQDGQVYQRNLGAKTARLARALTEYNPDSDWTLVSDQGVLTAASEK
jgi:hypothetical protein